MTRTLELKFHVVGDDPQAEQETCERLRGIFLAAAELVEFASITTSNITGENNALQDRS